MIREYRTIREVSGPLMIVKNVEGVTYDELAELELPNGEVRHCKVLECNGDTAVVQLVGKDALGAADQLTLEVARMVREDFLQQNAFLENDQYSSFDRQARLLELILRYKDLCDAAIARGADIWKLYAIAARAAIGRAKTVPADTYQDVYAKIVSDMEQQIEEVAKEAEAE